MKHDGAIVLRGDARQLPLPDSSVDLSLWSPPFYNVRWYEDGGGRYDNQIGNEVTPEQYIDNLVEVLAENVRVAKGPIFVEIGDRYCGYSGEKWGNGRSLGSSRGEARVPARGPRSAPELWGVPNKSLMLLPELFRIAAVYKLGLLARAVVIWDKPNAMPESVTDRPARTHSEWIMLTKGPRYYSAIDELRQPHKSAERPGSRSSYPSGSASGTVTADGGHFTKSDAGLPLNPLGRLPGSVWSIPVEPLRIPDYIVDDDLGWRLMDAEPLWRYAEHRVLSEGYTGDLRVREIDHWAAMAMEWPRRLILGWSPPGICLECGEGRWPETEAERHSEGPQDRRQAATRKPGHWAQAGRGVGTDRVLVGYVCACDTPTAPTRPAVVLDPFVGSGTTLMTARALGRIGVGVDRSMDYCRLSRWRIWDSGHTSRVMERTHRDRQGALL